MLALTSRRRCIVMQTCLKPNSLGRPALHDAATDEDAGISALLVRYATEYVAAETARLHLATARCRKYLVVEARVWFTRPSSLRLGAGEQRRMTPSGSAARRWRHRCRNQTQWGIPKTRRVPVKHGLREVPARRVTNNALHSHIEAVGRIVGSASNGHSRGRPRGRVLPNPATSRPGRLRTVYYGCRFARVGKALDCLCGSWGG